MALTLGNTSTNGAQSTTSSSHNNNGDYLILLAQGTTAPTGATYNSVAMTQIGTNQTHTAFGRVLNMWGLANPTAGSNTIAVTGSANVNYFAISITGVDQTTSTSGFLKTTQTSSTPNLTVTTTVDGAYVIAFAVVSSYTSIGANTTAITSVNGDPNTEAIRSTNVVSPAGNFTLNINSTGGETAMVAVGVNPVVSAVIHNFGLSGVGA